MTQLEFITGASEARERGASEGARVPNSALPAVVEWAVATLDAEPIGSAVVAGIIFGALTDSVYGFVVAAIALMLLRSWLLSSPTD